MMNRSLLFRKVRCIGAVGVLVFLGLTVIPMAKAGPPRTVKPVTYEQTYKEISAVDATAHTVTIATMSKEVSVGPSKGNEPPKADKQVKVETLKVTTSTVIEVDGKQSTLSALTNGMKVDVTKGMSDDEAERLVITQQDKK